MSFSTTNICESRPWANSHLNDIDDLLKCPICHEFMKTPMMLTKCSHIFCSICIRTYLSRNECATCRAKVTPMDLVRVPLIDNILTYWAYARTQADSVPSSTSLPNQRHVVTKKVKEEDVAPPKTEVEGVLCPFCNNYFHKSKIEIHANECLDIHEKDKPKPPVRSAVASPIQQKYLPRVVFHILKPADLRKLLTKYHLSTKGTKEEMIERHKQFRILHDSEVDAQVPISYAKLAQKVHEEEDIKARLKAKEPRTTDFKSKSEITTKDRESYIRRNSSSFDSLIAHIKKRSKTSQSSVEEPPTSEDISSHKVVENHTTDSLALQSPSPSALPSQSLPEKEQATVIPPSNTGSSRHQRALARAAVAEKEMMRKKQKQ